MYMKLFKYNMFWVLTIILYVSLTFLSGCGVNKNSSVQNEHVITDSIGRQVSIPKNISKAVVVNRYNMEIVKSIGAIDKIVGVDYGIYSDQKVYGKFFDKNQIVGKSQNALNYEKIIELNPQILITTGNGSWEDADRKLAPFGIKVIVLDAYYTEKFEETYKLAGKIFNKEQRADQFIGYFKSKLAYINKQLANVPKKTVYFEYKNKGTTTVPGDYFYNMLEYAHADNIFKDSTNTSIDIEAVVTRNPDAIIKVGEAGAEPRYEPPSKDEFIRRKENIINRAGWEYIKAVKNDNILLLSQYVHGGAAKLVGTMYIAKFLYPEYLPDLHPEEVFKEWVTNYQNMPYVSGHTYPEYSLTD